MPLVSQALALFALCLAVTAQGPPPASSSVSYPQATSSVPQLSLSISAIFSVPAPSSPDGHSSTSTRPARPAFKTSSPSKPSKYYIPTTTAPIATEPSGFTTTVYVTATIINQVEVISICSTDRALTTIIEESASCETYTTCITIPASLCETFVSTQDNGHLTTCTTPVDTWTEFLTTAVTSTATVSSIETVAPAGSGPAQTVNSGAASQPHTTSIAGSQGASPAPDSPAGTQTTYATAGSGRFVASNLAVCICLVAGAFALV